MWGQSLYVIGKLLRDGLIAPGELDPLNRRLAIQPKPDMVVQVSVLAEDDEVKIKLLEDHNINVQTVADVAPIQIYPAKVLAYIYSFLGKNKRLGLTGRPVTDIGRLSSNATLYIIVKAHGLISWINYVNFFMYLIFL